MTWLALIFLLIVGHIVQLFVGTWVDFGVWISQAFLQLLPQVPDTLKEFPAELFVGLPKTFERR